MRVVEIEERGTPNHFATCSAFFTLIPPVSVPLSPVVGLNSVAGWDGAVSFPLCESEWSSEVQS